MTEINAARRHTAAVVTLSAAEVAGKVATLATFVVVARSSSVADYGLFSYALGLGLLLAVLSSLGLDARLIQLAGRAPQTLEAWLSALVGARVAMAAGLILATWGVLAWTSTAHERRVVVLALLVAALLDTIGDAFRAAAAARGRQSGPALVMVVQRFVTLGAVAAAAGVATTVQAAAVAYLAGAFVGCALMAIAARRAGARVRPRVVRGHHLLDLAGAVPVYGGNAMVSMALFRIDTVILAVLAGDAAVGHYAAAYRLIETTLFISWSVSRVVAPILARRGPDDADSRRVLNAAYVAVSAIYLPYALALVLEGDRLVRLLFGAGFETTALFWWLALAPWLFGLAHLAATTLLSWSPDRWVLAASGAALAVNVALNLVLVPRWGELGAAAATTVAFAVQVGVTWPRMRCRVDVAHVARGVAVAATASVVMGAAMSVATHVWSAVLVGAVVYVPLWWALTRRWDRRTAAMVATVLARRQGEP